MKMRSGIEPAMLLMMLNGSFEGEIKGTPGQEGQEKTFTQPRGSGRDGGSWDPSSVVRSVIPARANGRGGPLGSGCIEKSCLLFSCPASDPNRSRRRSNGSIGLHTFWGSAILREDSEAQDSPFHPSVDVRAGSRERCEWPRLVQLVAGLRPSLER